MFEDRGKEVHLDGPFLLSNLLLSKASKLHIFVSNVITFVSGQSWTQAQTLCGREGRRGNIEGLKSLKLPSSRIY